MSMPHECKCGICGRPMSYFTFDWAKPGDDLSVFWCTKHGAIGSPGPCPKCDEEKRASDSAGDAP